MQFDYLDWFQSLFIMLSFLNPNINFMLQKSVSEMYPEALLVR